MILSAPDLQLDCLEDDDNEDGDDEEEDDDDEDGQPTNNDQHRRICAESFLESGSSDAATTSTDSGEDGPSTAQPSPAGRPQRFRSASTSDTAPPQPKIRRLNSHRDPFGHANDVLSNNAPSSNSLYVPHVLLLRRQQLQRELHRRFRTYTRDENDGSELELPLSYSLARHRLLVSHNGRGIESRLNMLLQLIGVRGLNTGLRQEVIEQHTTTSKYLSEDVADKEEDREKCTICLANFEVDIEIRTLNCKHCFHTNCVDRWLKCNKQCPMCRIHVDAATNAKTILSTAPSAENPPSPPPAPPSLS